MTKPLIAAALITLVASQAYGQAKTAWTDKKALAQQCDAYIKEAFRKLSIKPPTFLHHDLYSPSGTYVNYDVVVKSMTRDEENKFNQQHMDNMNAHRVETLFGRTINSIGTSDGGNGIVGIFFMFNKPGEDNSSLPKRPASWLPPKGHGAKGKGAR